MTEAAKLPIETDARERIMESAYELFSRRGVHAVGIEEVVDNAAVAKATLYRHFALEGRARARLPRAPRSSYGRRSGSRRRRGSAATRPSSSSSRSSTSSTSGSAATTSRGAPSSTSCSRWTTARARSAARAPTTSRIRTILRTLAEEGGFRDPDAFAHSWHILMKGSIVAAGEGDREAATRAKAMGRLLIDQYR